MSQIVSTPQQAVSNIHHFQQEVAKSGDLQERLAYVRSWYAIREDDGRWLFGPSKFIGYRDMTAKEYLNDDPRDGRQTERKLTAWFVPLPDTNELYETLCGQLADFLELYGKAPSAAMRLNILGKDLGEEGGDVFNRYVADLIIAITANLPPAERVRIRAAL